MVNKLRVKTISPIIVLVAVSIIAFLLANTYLNRGPAYADDGIQFTNVNTPEEASILAGYQVSTPAFIPQTFKGSPNITVHDTNDVSPKQVIQIWSSPDREFIVFTQDPSLDGIGGGEEAEVCGVLGERKYSKARADRPAILSLYWRSGDMAYVLTGSLKGTIDEATF